MATLDANALARVNITFAGLNGDLLDDVRFDANDADVKAIVAEAIGSGAVRGIEATRVIDLRDFIVDRFPADNIHPMNRIFVRPRTPFG